MSETSEAVCKVGHFSWNELVTTNTKAAGAFYGKLFGWQESPFTAEGMPKDAPPYTLFKTDPNEMGVGGMMQAMKPGMPAQWIPYVVVEDIDGDLAHAVELGGKMLVPVMPIPEVGRIAVIQDPQGATIGLHQPEK